MEVRESWMSLPATSLPHGCTGVSRVFRECFAQGNSLTSHRPCGSRASVAVHSEYARTAAQLSRVRRRRRRPGRDRARAPRHEHDEQTNRAKFGVRGTKEGCFQCYLHAAPTPSAYSIYLYIYHARVILLIFVHMCTQIQIVHAQLEAA